MRLLDGGVTLSAVARMVGAAVSAVWQWRETLRRRGPEGLAAKPASGRPRKLTSRQRQRVPRLLRAGARAYGFSNDLWTTRRIATVLEQKLGVTYHPAHVSRLLADLGWTYQKPERRAIERDEAMIAHWKRYSLGRQSKKSPAPERPSGVPGRIGLPADPKRAPHVGAPGTDPAWSAIATAGTRSRRSPRSRSVPPRRHWSACDIHFHPDQNITHVEVAVFLRARCSGICAAT